MYTHCGLCIIRHIQAQVQAPRQCRAAPDTYIVRAAHTHTHTHTHTHPVTLQAQFEARQANAEQPLSLLQFYEK